jgi:hypothetical protein
MQLNREYWYLVGFDSVESVAGTIDMLRAMPDAPAPPPGWYPDPDAHNTERWWDGSRWGPLKYTPRLTTPAPAPGKLSASERRMHAEIERELDEEDLLAALNRRRPRGKTALQIFGGILALGFVVLIVVAAVGAVSSKKAPPAATTACSSTMTQAENEPTESDTAILATLDDCLTADQWINALQEHPKAGTLTSYTRQDAIEFLDMACIRRSDAAVCIDAAAQGHLTYELDDPRLVELQVPLG